MIASAKNRVAQYRPAVELPWSASRRTAKTGTTASRSMVSALGRLTSARSEAASRRGPGRRHSWPSALRLGEGGHDGRGDQVDALAADDLGGHDRARFRALAHPGDRRCAVAVGVLVGRGAGPLAVAEILQQQDLHALPEAVLGPLRGELLDQVGDPADAGVDLGLVQLAGQPDRLGALLVGVAEHPDRVEARLGEEAL